MICFIPIVRLVFILALTSGNPVYLISINEDAYPFMVHLGRGSLPLDFVYVIIMITLNRLLDLHVDILSQRDCCWFVIIILGRFQLFYHIVPSMYSIVFERHECRTNFACKPMVLTVLAEGTKFYIFPNKILD
jgi:hypothetical protein